MSSIPSSVRAKVRARDRGQCLRCGGDGTELQHRMRRREGGHHLWNLVTMCGTCHRGWAHANPEQARTFGWIISVHHDSPETVPLYTFWGEWVVLTADGRYESTPPPA